MTAAMIGPVTWPRMNWSVLRPDRVGDLVARDQSGQDRDDRRLGDRVGRVEREERDDQHGLGRDPGEGHGRQRGGDGARQDVGGDHDPAAVEPIGHDPARDREQEDRQEPGEVEEADGERRSGQLVHEDRAGHGLQPGAKVGQEPAGPVDGERPVAERTETA